jgi:hypothetical protein
LGYLYLHAWFTWHHIKSAADNHLPDFYNSKIHRCNSSLLDAALKNNLKQVMNTRFSIKIAQAGIIALIFTIISVSDGKAQSSASKKNMHYLGFRASFGRRFFKSESDYAQINRDNVSVEGGQVGITFGNRTLRGDLGLIGYYSSVSNIAGTIDYYTNHATIKFYPVSLLTKKHLRFEPYLAAGATYDRYKFYGHYALEDQGSSNYSGNEPFLGAIRRTSTCVGIGMEFRIIDEYDFIHLFTELKMSKPKSNVRSSIEFADTRVGGNTYFNIGVAFGYYR